MTPRERAKGIRLWIERCIEIESGFVRSVESEIEKAITADRQQIQSELLDHLKKDLADSESKRIETVWANDTYGAFYREALRGVINKVQTFFASPYDVLPSEEKPKIQGEIAIEAWGIFDQSKGRTIEASVFGQKMITQAESDRRVLAEREALLREIEGLPIHAPFHYSASNAVWYARRAILEAIRSRPNPEQGSEPEKEDAKKESPKYDYQILAEMLQQGKKVELDPVSTVARIAFCHQIIGEQQIKIAQLEKEKHELTQKLSASINSYSTHWSRGGS